MFSATPLCRNCRTRAVFSQVSHNERAKGHGFHLSPACDKSRILFFCTSAIVLITRATKPDVIGAVLQIRVHPPGRGNTVRTVVPASAAHDLALATLRAFR